MSSWKFPRAPEPYCDYVYSGEVGERRLTRNGDEAHWVQIQIWDSDSIPVAYGLGSGVAVHNVPKPPTVQERGAGLKFDSGKPRWSLLMRGCALALLGVVKVLTFGAKKYSADSWRGVANGAERYRDALYRHLNAIESGEVIDPESGESHWSHVATNALFLEELRLSEKSG